jgi:high-affinity iron transporter
MKFIFNFAVAALALAVAGCAGPRASAPAAPDGGDAQRAVALLDYIGGDYVLAVRDGAVISEPEYQEQRVFAADARRLAGALLAPSPADDAVRAALAEVETRVLAKAPPEAVAEACRAGRDMLVARFSLPTTPVVRPSLARAEALYAEACAACHGARGDARTERAATLDPPPASFRDAERLRDLSPYRVYNALTFGVPGTAMASFSPLSAEDRWSLAFYVFRLGHEGTPGKGPVAMTLGDLATRSDAQVLEALRAEAHPDAQAALVYARRESAFREVPAGAGLDQTRRLVAQGVRSYREGRTGDADRLVLDAYLSGFEPLEPRLRGRDPAGTAEVESLFREVRAALARDDRDGVELTAAALQDRLRGIGGERRAVVPMLAAFVIYFREGIEAALLVGALLAGVRRTGRAHAARWLHAGWVLALPAGALTWWAADRVVALGAQRRELLEGLVSLAAAAVLFSVSFWLISRVEARRWMQYLRRQVDALSGRNLLMLAGLSFLAVYREAAETVLFTQALLLESEGHRGQVYLGAAAGLLAVVAAAVLLKGTLGRLPLRPLFAVSGALLCGLAIVFAGSGIYALVAAGYLSPRPVTFPEVPWLGIHPDLSGLLVQLAIVAVVVSGALLSLRRTAPEPAGKDRS